MLPTILVETPSKVPPITPPTSGIILPKLIAPFSPNLVRSLKPTRLLIAVIVSLVSVQREPSGHNLKHPTKWCPPNK